MMLHRFASVLLAAFLAASAFSGEPIEPFETADDLTPNNRIDELVFAKLKQVGIQPANLCSDAVFVRRVYLDVIGTLPTAEEAKQFIDDTSPDKRSRLIDELLERKGFADYWALKWSDILRIKAEFPINLWPNAVQAYYQWVHDCVRDNVPYDQFARQLLTSSGSNFRVPPVNFYRAMQDRSPEGIAKTVALTFMGVRADRWPKEQLQQFSLLFSQIGYKRTLEWKEEIVYWDRFSEQAAKDAGKTIVMPDGSKIVLEPDRDPRQLFADWLIRADNPWFAKCAVNRVWYWLMGRGIIHEPDDIRPDNPPSNPELLAYLEKELVQSGWDLKHIYRLILNSKTYQLSSIPADDNPKAAEYFAYYPMRRLDAEVLIDAICQITGTHEEYFSMVPEPYTFLPERDRTIMIPDGSITSSFLEMFGRPPRDTGLLLERNNHMTAAQRLHLLNSTHILRKIEQGPGLAWLRQFRPNPKKPWAARQTIQRLYLTVLSRYPTAQELQTIRRYWEKNRSGQVGTDIAWALINSSEFLYRH